jgi:hypothetical protein
MEGKTARYIKRKEMVVVDEILMTSCSTLPRPYYETPEGRKKLKYYNALVLATGKYRLFPKTRIKNR